MKAIFTVSLLLAGASIFSSCRDTIVEGHGSQGNDTRTISRAFNSIEIDAPVDADITVQTGSAATFSVSGYNNLLKYIRTEVKDSTLRIYVPEITELHTDKNLKALITVPALESISVSGSSDVRILGQVTVPEFSVDFSGAGTLGIQSLQADKLSVEMSGATTFTASSGKVAKAEYDLSGAVTVKAYGLECDKARIDLSGAGDAELFVNQKLRADVSGAGSVSYKGNPQVESDVSGVGSVNRVDSTPATHAGTNSTPDSTDTDEW